MIENRKEDLLKSNLKVICHQVNCKGVMGAGVAKQIKAKWYDTIYMPYRKVCLDKINTKDLLGKVQVLKTGDKPIEYVINIFSQHSYSEAECPFPDGRHTDYYAVAMCFAKVKEWLMKHKIHEFAIPYKIGCGLAGGDWDGVVYPMIKRLFENDKDITLYIYEFNPNQHTSIK